MTRSVELAEQEAVLKERDLAVQSQAGFGFGGCFVSVINWGQGTLGDTWNMAWMFGSVSDFLGKVLVILSALKKKHISPPIKAAHQKSQLEAQELESKQKLLSREMADVTAKKDKLSEARRQLEEPLAGADLLSFFFGKHFRTSTSGTGVEPCRSLVC